MDELAVSESRTSTTSHPTELPGLVAPQLWATSGAHNAPEPQIRPGCTTITTRTATTIHDFPHELLAAVFEAGAHTALQDGGLPFPVLVSHVCRHWRAVACSAARVWCSVPVHPGKDATTALFLARCSPPADRPLDVCLHATRPLDGLDRALRLVAPTAGRWARLYVRASGAPGVFLVFRCLRAVRGLVRLRHFELRVAGRQGAIGWLPAELGCDGAPPPRLERVALLGMSFQLRSPLLGGLRDLTLGYLPRGMSAPTVAEFGEVLAASPLLEHLKLARVFPQLSELVAAQREVTLRHLRTLELVMKRAREYVPLFFQMFSAPALEQLSFESGWSTTWEGFEAAIPILAAKYENLSVLRLIIPASFEFDDVGFNPEVFGAFPLLRELSLNVLEDAQAHYFLSSWISVLSREDDGFGLGPAYQDVWPFLELLTVRAPYDDHTDDPFDDMPPLDDSLALLGSLRLSLGQPFDVWQESIFANFTPDSLDTD